MRGTINEVAVPSGFRPFTLNIGTEYESMGERRKGYLNNNGSLTTLKRDEDDDVYSVAAYAQGEWRFAENWIVLGGVRANSVAFRVNDYYIAPGNGDDSGRKRYSAATPVLGVLYKATPAVSVYANAGSGFETPTFAELAYRIGVDGGVDFTTAKDCAQAGALPHPGGDMAECRKLEQLQILVALESVMPTHGGEDFRLLDGIYAEVGFHVEVKFQHVLWVAGLFGDHGEYLGLNGVGADA